MLPLTQMTSVHRPPHLRPIQSQYNHLCHCSNAWPSPLGVEHSESGAVFDPNVTNFSRSVRYGAHIRRLDERNLCDDQ